MVGSSSMWHAGAIRGLARFLRNGGPFDLMLIMVETYDLAMGIARGMVLHSIQAAQWRCVCPQCFFTFEEFVSQAGEATDKTTCVELSVNCAE